MHTAVVIYRLAVSLWLGGAAIFTFVLTPVLFRSEQRDRAAAIVGFLFPPYFRWGIACGLVALVCRLALLPGDKLPEGAILAAMLGISLFQAFFIEPRAAALKREIPSFETTPKDHPLRQRFARLHGVSAVGNFAVIAGGVALVALF